LVGDAINASIAIDTVARVDTVSNPASKLVRKAAETVTNQQGDFYSGIKNIFFSSADCM